MELPIILVSVGVAAFILLWYVITGIRSFVQNVQEVESDQMILDGRFLKSAYPVYHTISHMFRPFTKVKIIERYRVMSKKLLRACGLSDDLDGDDVFGMMVMSGLVIGLYGVLVGVMLERPLLVTLQSFVFPAVLLGSFLPVLALRDRRSRRQSSIRRGMPFSLDLLTLSVESGMDFTAALRLISQRISKTPLGQEFQTTLREISMGITRSDALRAMADRSQVQELRTVVMALIQADELGSSLGPVLRVQGQQLRTKRFQYAEKKAMEAPVKMMLPLIGFIMPQVFAIIFGPLVLRIIDQGIPGITD